MKTGVWGFVLAVLAAVGSHTPCFADEVEVPFSVYAERFQAEAKEKGLNLSCADEADGCIKTNGTFFVVMTYKPLTEKGRELIKELSFKHMRR